MATEILRPNSLELNQSDKWHASSGSNYWDLVDEVTPNDSDYVYDDDALVAGEGYRIRFGFPSPTSVQSGDTINSITVYWRAKSINGSADATPFLYDGSNQDGTEVTNLGTSYTTRNESIGSGWTYSDLANIEAGVNYTGPDGKDGGLYLSWFYIEIDYTEAAGSPSPETEETERLAHDIDLAQEVTPRFAHDTELYKRAISKISHVANIDQFDPDWYDGDISPTPSPLESPWYKRRLINFGNNHSTLPAGATVNFELFTGYEQKMPDINCVTNEAMLQCIGRNNIYYMTWIAYSNPDDWPSPFPYPSPGVSEENFQIYIVKYDATTGIWSDKVWLFDNQTYFDSHFAPTMLLDSNGYIHLFYGVHRSTPIRYYRSKNPYDITEWDKMPGFSQTVGSYTATFSYPAPCEDDSGNIYLGCRVGYGGAPSELASFYCYFKSTDGGDTWGSLKTVIDYQDNYYSNASMYGNLTFKNGKLWYNCIFHDGYLKSWQMTRSCGLIWSMNGQSWYEYKDGNNANWVGETGNWEPGTTWYGRITYSSVTKIFLSSDAEWGEPPAQEKMIGPTYATWGGVIPKGTHDDIIYIALTPSQSAQLDQSPYDPTCQIIAAKYDYSAKSWSKINLSELLGIRVFGDRFFYGSSLSDDNTVKLYFMAVPENEYDCSPVSPCETWPNKRRFGAELYRITGSDFGNPSKWTGEYLTKDTGYGCGLGTVNDSGQKPAISFCRANDGFLLLDEFYPHVMKTGDDVRVVRHDQYGAYELDRVPDRFQAQDSSISFMLDVEIPENQPWAGPTNRHYVYYDYPNAPPAPNNPLNVWPYYEGFESLEGGWKSGDSLDGVDGWECDYPDDFLVIRVYDRINSDSAHTNKCWSGMNYVEMFSNQASPPVSPYNISEARRPLALDNHYLRFRLWFDAIDTSGDTYLYMGVKNINVSPSPDESWVKVGLSPNKRFCYRRSGDAGWTEVNTDVHQTGQHYTFQFLINSNGISASAFDGGGNETVILNNDAELTETSHIIMGIENESGIETAGQNRAVIDDLMAWVYIENEPTVTLGPEEGADSWDMKRLSHTAALRFHREERLGQIADVAAHKTDRLAQYILPQKEEMGRIANALVMNKNLTKRLSNVADVAAHDITRLSHITGLDKNEAKKLAHIIYSVKNEVDKIAHQIIADKETTASIAHITTPIKELVAAVAHGMAVDKEQLLKMSQDIDLDAIKYMKLAHLLETDKELFANMSHTLGLSRERITEIAHSLQVEREIVVALCNIAALDRAQIMRLANELDLTYIDIIRFAHYLAVDKEIVYRMAHTAPLAGAEVIRLAQTLGLSKTTIERMRHDTFTDKETIARLAGYLETDKELTAQLAHYTGLAQEQYDKIAHEVLTNKELVIILPQTVDLNKTLTGRLAHLAPLEGIYAERLAHFADLRTEKVMNIAHLVGLTVSESTRLAHNIEFVPAATIRFANTVVPRKIETVRLPQFIDLEQFTFARLAQTINLTQGAFEKLAHQVFMTANVTTNLAHTAGLNKTLMLRLAHGVPLHYIETTRIPHYLQLYAHSVSRMAHIAEFYSIDLSGLHIENQTIAPLAVTGQTLAPIFITDGVLAALAISEQTLTTIAAVEQTLAKLRIDDQITT